MRPAALAKFTYAVAAAGLAILPLGFVLAVAEEPTSPVANSTPPMPDAEAIVILVRTSLLTLNDAVQSGNFTVLRDLAAPGFRDANTAAKLSHIFSALARDDIDLSKVAVASPQLSEAPRIDAGQGKLTIKGFFQAGAGKVNFGVMYQDIRGQWRLYGIFVKPAVAAFGASPAAAQAFSKKAPTAPEVPVGAVKAPLDKKARPDRPSGANSNR